jgi:hypothetical protein
MGLENFTFQPLHSYSENAVSIHADIKDDISKKIQEGKYSQGLIDQYKLQLARLEQLLPAYEIVTFPGLMNLNACMLFVLRLFINLLSAKNQILLYRGRNTSR